MGSPDNAAQAWVHATRGNGPHEQQRARLDDARPPERFDEHLRGWIVQRFPRPRSLRRFVTEQVAGADIHAIAWDGAINGVAFDVIEKLRSQGVLSDLLLALDDHKPWSPRRLQPHHAVPLGVVVVVAAIAGASLALREPGAAGWSLALLGAVAASIAAWLLRVHDVRRPGRVLRTVAMVALLGAAGGGVTAVALAQSDERAWKFAYDMGWCDLALRRLDRQHRSGGDFESHHARARCQGLDENDATASAVEAVLEREDLYQKAFVRGEADWLHMHAGVVLLGKQHQPSMSDLATPRPRQIAGKTALEHLTRSVSLEPDCALSQVLLAFTLAADFGVHSAADDAIVTKRLDRAEDLVTSGGDVCATSPRLLYSWRGRTFDALGDHNDEAEREHTRALDLCGDDPACRAEESVRIAMARAKRDALTPEALTAQLTGIADPATASSLLMVGALASFRRAVKLQSDPGALQREVAAGIAFARAALPASENPREVYALLAGLHYLGREYEVALSEASLWLQLSGPDEALARYWVMRNLIELERFPEAIAAGLAIPEDRRDAAVELWLGTAYLRSGQTKEAEPHFERALNGGDAMARPYLALTIMANADPDPTTDDPGPPTAEEVLRLERALQVLGDDPSQEARDVRPLLLRELADAYARRRENLALAEHYAEQAVALERTPEHIYTWAWIRLLRADAAGADELARLADELRAHFAEALAGLKEPDAGPSRAEVRYHLAFLEHRLGARELARSLVLEALREQPTHVEAKRLLEELR